MWKKNEPEQPAPQPKSQPSAPLRNHSPASAGGRAMIGPTIEIKGDLIGGEDLLIDGRIEGKIELKQNNVTVGKSGRVKADILGKMITVEGEVHGNLYGEEQLILRESSTVRGNIKCPRVILEDGSNFKGSIDMAPLTSADQGLIKAMGPDSKSQPAPTRVAGQSPSSGTDGKPVSGPVKHR